MAKTKISSKLKEADPIRNDMTDNNQLTDQNAIPSANPVPATDAEVNQAIEPTLADPVMPNDGTEPAADDVKVNPETVGMEIQIPTEQLASAVAQATGDVTAAETAPDALAAQEEDLVNSQTGDESVEGAPVSAPVEGNAEQIEQAPVLESKRSKARRVKESESSNIEANAEDKLQGIITTGVENTANGLSNGKATINGESKENRLDIIDTGVENTGEGIKEACAKEIKESIDDVEDDIGPGIEDPASGEADTEEPEEKLDFKKLLAGEEDNPDLPPALGEDDEEFENVNTDIFEDIDEEDISDFMNKMEGFLKDEDKAEEVADSLRTAADFIEEVADDDDIEDTLEDDDASEHGEEYEDDDEPEVEEEKFDFDSLLSGAYDADDEESEEDFEESVDSLAKEPKRRIKEAKVYYDLTDGTYRPWSGAVETWEKIEDAGKLDDLDRYIEEMYPDGIGETELNDLLRFEGDEVLDYLGISDEEDDDDFDESLVRVPCKFPKSRTTLLNGRCCERRENNGKRLSESGIKYPAGSEPDRDLVEKKTTNIVEAHDRVVRARREAIANFRESVERDRDTRDTQVRNPRFNEALRNSVRMTEKGSDKKSWSNNRFADKFEESSKLSFKDLLDNGYLG